MQDAKECFKCKQVNGLQEHHCIGGNGRRKLSEKYGLKVYLCWEHHEGNTGAHNDSEFADNLKRDAQEKAMQYYGWSIEDFIKIFGRNYL